MSGSQTLRRCPFCNAKAIVIPQVYGVQEPENVRWSVSCTGNDRGCGWTFFYCKTRDEAVAAWNRRADG